MKVSRSLARFGAIATMRQRLAATTVAAIAATALVTPVQAQQITSTIQGVVVSPTGAPVADAAVSITDTRTGRTASRTTDANGTFRATGLEVGGPYSVLVETPLFPNERLEGLFISTSAAASLSIQLEEVTADVGVDEIVVVGVSQQTLTNLAIGPGAVFGEQQLDDFPSIARDFRETLRIDPRVTLDEGNDNALSCNGNNNRFNSFTIDGVNVTDRFGLNASGLPSRNQTPIPLDATREVAVEFAPFDVQYSQFTGCNVNLVTKSGTNEFSGSAFGVFTNQGLLGSNLRGREIASDPFRDWNWGADIGGPIIEDKLFFYAAYEETKEADVQDDGPIGQGFSNEDVEVADIDAVSAILRDQYGIDTGGIQRNLPEDSRRIFGRLDWFITDDHRAAATYTRLRENNVEPDDFGFGNDFAYANNFEAEGSSVDIYSAVVFSDWSDNLSTEVRYSFTDTVDVQGPQFGGERQDENPVPRIFVDTPSGTVLSGPGFFRSANALETTQNQLKLKADYAMDTQVLTFGYELDRLKVFNLFAPNSVGSLEFDSIASLIAGTPFEVDYNDSFSGNINDAGANFTRSVHSLYAQTEWAATSDLTVVAGLRYDFYQSNQGPTENPVFIQRYGFSNDTGFDNLDAIMPRLGITYEAPWEFFGTQTYRMGAGVFSGGDPSVWFSNAYTNFGAALGTADENDAPCPADGMLTVVDANGNFTGIPTCVQQAAQASAQANRGNVDAIDPNFKLPTVVRGSWGLTHITDFQGGAGFFDDWQVDFDIIHTRARNSVSTIDLTLSPVGFAPDGRPIFNRIDSTAAGCNATFLGPRRGFGGVPIADLQDGGVCADGSSGQDTLLTNVEDGKNSRSTSLSIRFSKDWDYTLMDSPGSFSFNMGYNYTSAKDSAPHGSSTAGSNVEEVALSVINNSDLAASPFLVAHNFTLAATARQDFFDELTSSLTLLFRARSGNPYSVVFDDNSTESFFGDSDDETRQLLYIPNGPADQLVGGYTIRDGGTVRDATDAEIAEWFAGLESIGADQYAGQIAPRNVFRDPWFKDLDVRFQQELPTYFEGHNFKFFVDFENVLNMFSGSGNIRSEYDRGDIIEGVPLTDDASIVSLDANGRYIYNIGDRGNVTVPELDDQTTGSLWTIQFGVRYEF